jgi:hypothetical protein
VLLLIDDSHDFKAAAWEEIERLLAFKVDKRPVLELLVAGPLSVARRLHELQERVSEAEILAYTLPSPSPPDLMGYLEWRLQRFELGKTITPVAAQMIARLSGGRYAAADVLGQMSLLVLRQLRLERVDARVVRQAVAALVARQHSKLEVEEARATEHHREVSPQGHLLISRGGKLFARVTLGPRTLVGRSEHNDVCLPSPYLSRHHVGIVGTPEGYYLVDLNSANGVTLNGQRVERAVLCDQDVLTIGPFRLKIQLPESLAQASPLPAADSLADTALMPQEAREGSAFFRVK